MTTIAPLAAGPAPRVEFQLLSAPAADPTPEDPQDRFEPSTPMDPIFTLHSAAGSRNAGGPAPPPALGPGALPANSPHLPLQWPSNTWVAASSRQDQLTGMQSQWLDQILNELRTAPSLPAAAERVRGRNFRTEANPQHAINSTHTSPGWRKNENRPRIVLIIKGQGKNDNENALTERESTLLQQRLREEYGPNIHFIVLDRPTPQQVQQAMQRMQQFGQDNAGAESLIYFTGHGWHSGTPAGMPADARQLNGSANGLVWLRGENWDKKHERYANNDYLTEAQLKRWTAQYLGGFNANVVMFHCCGSGSWVASNQNPGSGGPALA